MRTNAGGLVSTEVSRCVFIYESICLWIYYFAVQIHRTIGTYFKKAANSQMINILVFDKRKSSVLFAQHPMIFWWARNVCSAAKGLKEAKNGLEQTVPLFSSFWSVISSNDKDIYGFVFRSFKHIAAVILKRQMNVRQFFLLSPLTFWPFCSVFQQTEDKWFIKQRVQWTTKSLTHVLGLICLNQNMMNGSYLQKSVEHAMHIIAKNPRNSPQKQSAS